MLSGLPYGWGYRPGLGPWTPGSSYWEWGAPRVLDLFSEGGNAMTTVRPRLASGALTAGRASAQPAVGLHPVDAHVADS